jgi:hypothetical protein
MVRHERGARARQSKSSGGWRAERRVTGTIDEARKMLRPASGTRCEKLVISTVRRPPAKS